MLFRVFEIGGRVLSGSRRWFHRDRRHIVSDRSNWRIIAAPADLRTEAYDHVGTDLSIRSIIVVWVWIAILVSLSRHRS